MNLKTNINKFFESCRFSISKSTIFAILIIAFIAFGLALISNKYGNPSSLGGRMLLFFLIGFLLWTIRPASFIHSCPLFPLTAKKIIGCVFVLLMISFAIIRPMSINGSEIGKIQHYNQYQRLAESFLNGHLYIDYDNIDPKLKAMDNPYSPEQREQEGVSYYWDHAWYNNHYYMYFGVVPVIILFLPLKLLGISIAEYQATQVFSFLALIGIFTLFLEIVKTYCKKISLSAYLSLTIAASCISLWFAIKCPALYCTAITSGICLAIWGFFFIFKAFISKNSRHKLLYIILGASFSALVFGCRPTIGFISLAYIPMIIHFIAKQAPSEDGKTMPSSFFKALCKKENIIKLAAFCIPYIIVAVLLMSYNYLRFENPFEFGQSYQLTTADQHTYMSDSSRNLVAKIPRIIKDFAVYMVAYSAPSKVFPFIHMYGVIILFPVLLLSLKSVNWWNNDRYKTYVKGLPLTLFAIVLVTSTFQSLWSPFPIQRYTLDFNYVLGILMLLGVCTLFTNNKTANRKISFKLSLLAAYTCFISFLLFFVAGFDSSIDAHPEILEKVQNLIIFWK